MPTSLIFTSLVTEFANTQSAIPEQLKGQIHTYKFAV